MFLVLALLFSNPADYQIGSLWSKFEVTSQVMQRETPAFQRAAYATAQVGGGTGFYLGKFNGFHVIATNHHVCSMGAQCLETFANFPLLKKNYEISTWLGTFREVDLTLMAINVPPADEPLLQKIGRNFSYDHPIVTRQKLMSIGFGAAGNPSRKLMATQDADCIVLSKSGDYRYLPDPDSINPLPNPVWSFAAGCDVSHGDSGSAMIDRSTGNLIGIFWTGKMPKPAQVKSSEYVQKLARSGSEEVWNEFTYVVPASKIPAAVESFVTTRPYLTQDVRAALLKIIGR